MKDRDVHRLIEKQEPELKDKIYKKLEDKIDLNSVETIPAAKKKINTKSVIGFLTCLCLVSISISLPFLLRNNSVEPSDRYCTQNDYVMQNVEYTIQDYAIQKNKSLLFLNWYDVAEEIKTTYYSEINDVEDMICLKEFIVNGETGDIANLYITDNRTTVDFIEPLSKLCIDEQVINNVTVQYGIGLDESIVQFEFDGYKYLIDFEDAYTIDYITQIVSEMINA